MNAQWYKDRGYNVSIHLSQNLLDLAERLMIDNYLIPLCGSYDDTDDDQLNAMAELVYLYVCLMTTYATLTGGKDKATSESTQPTYEDILQKRGAIVDALLQKLKVKFNTNMEVNDILKIYFKTNFLFN